jgi:hypothetical protein
MSKLLDDLCKPHNRKIIKVNFIKIGSTDKSWSIDCEEQWLCYDFLYTELKLSNSIMSRNIDFKQYKDNENKYGVFVGLVRHIGDIEIIK